MFFFWVIFLACDSGTPSRTSLERGTLWTPVKEAGEGTPVEEEGEVTSVEGEGEGTSVEGEEKKTPLEFLILLFFSFPARMVLEIIFNFLASNILFVLPFNFFLLCLTFSLSLLIISPVSSADNCLGLFLNLAVFEVIN